MAIKTWHFRNGGINSCGLLSETVNTTETGPSGWVAAKTAAGYYSNYEYAVERAASTFQNGTALPSSWITSACYMRSNSGTNGVFAAGNWTITTRWIAVTNGGALDARVRYWVGYSTDGWGSGITQFSGTGTLIGATMTNIATATAQESGVTFAMPQWNGAGFYFYCQMALEILGAGTNNGADCLMRHGIEGNGCIITTTDFVDGLAASGAIGTVNVSGLTATAEVVDATLKMRTCVGAGL